VAVDGVLPRPSDWVDGPGGIRPDPRSWLIARRDYDFVDQFAALRPKVRGAGHRERFDYWLNNFQYMRAMAQLNCLWGEFNQTLGRIKQESDPQKRRSLAREWLLPIRIRMVQSVARVYEHLLGTLTNTSELGTVANWEQHLLPEVLVKPGQDLARELGEPLPPEAQPNQAYHGPVRVLVPAVRTSVTAGDPALLKVIVLAQESPRDAVLCWRPLGRGPFRSVALDPVGRGVYATLLPCVEAQVPDFEYYLKVTPARSKTVVWPATAPRLNQTVIVRE
jgi:hypothetical protein